MAMTPAEKMKRYRERKSGVTVTENEPVTVTALPIVTELRVTGKHDHTCPDCQKVWSCSFEQDGTCWRDPHCLKHAETPPYEIPSTTNCRHGKRYCRQCGTTIQPITATPEQWTNAYNLMQDAKERASTADKQAARQAAAQQG